MRVSIRKIQNMEDEQVVLECVELTRDFQDIQEYAMAKGNLLAGYLEDALHQIKLTDILYFEALDEQVFAYTDIQIYTIKKRLYELEQLYEEQGFVRCSKSILVNLRMIVSFRPALDSRYYARLKNGEEIIVSRMYAKSMKRRVMEGLK